MKKSIIGIVVCLAMIVSFTPGIILAGENSPRDYTCPPGPGIVTGFYHDHLSGNELYSNGTKVGDDFNFSGNVSTFRFSRFFEAGPILFDPTILLSGGEVSIDGSDAGGQNISSSGMADPMIGSAFWFVRDFKNREWASFASSFSIPIGEYDNLKPVNLGENRWHFREEIAFVKGFSNGLYVDLVGYVDLFTDNDDYGPFKQTQEKDPIYTLESHLSYDISPACFISADYYYHTGGETTIAGIEQNDEQNDHLGQLTFAYWISPNHQLMVKYRVPLDVENGPEINTLGVRWIYWLPK